MQKDAVRNAPVKIDEHKHEDKKWHRIRKEVFKSGMNKGRKQNAGQSFQVERVNTKPNKIIAQCLFQNFDYPESKYKQRRKQQAVEENAFLQLHVQFVRIAWIVFKKCH